jgi:acyl carrier protein
MSLDDADLRTRVRALLARHVPDPDAPAIDLDSLARVELLEELEQALGVMIPARALRR